MTFPPLGARMRIYIDATEPGAFLLGVRKHAERAGIPVQRTLLHKREGIGASLRERHPLYGSGCDVIITDDALVPTCAMERKTLDDLARSATVGRDTEAPRFFRQMKDLARQPTPLLLLEGTPSFLYRQTEPMMVGLQFWLAREGIAIIATSSLGSSARAVAQIAKKLRDTYDFDSPRDPALRFDVLEPDKRPA